MSDQILDSSVGREAAEAAIGSILLDDSMLPVVRGLLPVEAFDPWPQLKLIYQAMIDLHKQKIGIDLTTVVDELKRRGDLTKAGGPAYVAALPMQVFSPQNADYYAKIVREFHFLRRMCKFAINFATEISSGAIRSGQEALDKLVTTTRAAAEWWTRGLNHADLKTTVDDCITKLETDQYVPGLPTGIPELDEITGGLHPGALVVVGARPSVGKTALSVGFTIQAGMTFRRLESAKRVVFVSLEMTQQMIVERMLSYMSCVPLHLILRPYLLNGHRSEMINHVRATAKTVSELPVDIIEADSASRLTNLEGSIQRIASRAEIGLIVIDYIQLISAGKKESRVQELAEITRSLKLIALRYNAPVVALSQLNRNIEHSEKRRVPTLADLRDSGSIEQDADIVLFPVRERNENEPVVERAGIIVAKHRNGPIGNVECAFIKPIAAYVPTQDAKAVAMEVSRWRNAKHNHDDEDPREKRAAAAKRTTDSLI